MAILKKLVELKGRHFWTEGEEMVQPPDIFGVVTVRKMGSDSAALMKVERWFELFG